MTLISSCSDAKFVEGFLNDLRNLSNEAKKQHNVVKEASEIAIIRLRNLSQNDHDMREHIISHCLDLLQPILLAVESGNSELIILGLQTLQRLFAHEAVAEASFPAVLNCFWSLMESRVEQLKLLQTITVILTSSNSLHGDHLAKVLVICLRMYFSKDLVVNSSAGAAIRQLVPLLFEKGLEETRPESHNQTRGSGASNGHSTPSSPRSRSTNGVPSGLSPCAADAYALLKDLCLVIAGEQPSWLVGITDMTGVLALQLIESILSGYRALFNVSEFSTLLRERLCPSLIKLLSPCTRTTKSTATSMMNAAVEMPSFAITVNLVRNVYVILATYQDLLKPESEVFYSLLNKFVESERLPWLRILGLEVYYRLFSDPKVVMLISQTYSIEAASEGVFGNILSTFNNYILAFFVKAPASPAPTSPPQTPANSPVNLNPTFTYRGVSIQLTPVGGLVLLDSRDVEAPPVTDNYAIALAFTIVRSISKTLSDLLEKLSVENAYKENVWNLVQNSWRGVLAAMDGPECILESLLESLDATERTIFDNLMDSVTTVVMHDLIKDEMNASHRPMEPTPEFLESLQNTGEDLFCNPWEYMLHTPDICPNCEQPISLSKMAPHIVSKCKSGNGRRRRKASPAQRQTRSGASSIDPDPDQGQDSKTNSKRPADDYPTASVAQVKRLDNGR